MWEKLQQRLHLLLILGSLWLIVTSPWVLIGRQLRASASWWDIGHVYLGLAMLPLAALFLLKNCRQGHWRLYFPYLGGQWQDVGRDCRNLCRGKLPVAGGAGLISVIEGGLMLLLVGTCLTGAMWFVQQGGSDALFWRGWHIDMAWAFGVGLIVHMLCAMLHVIDMMR
ncbi:cytochrome b/b6 domain-containing protein [Shewanella sp. NIFS-20-20]|uniref:cytochrome b/b6 domain-containing protein n=1 Tax=Shewanella sp. NIFS-20-20 TaxID=2853806 RepID=UPI001C46DEFE|nr:cytochrome b/b6 domain-containing protein [Shewanella sp. NIFS-20-20]MBV7315845.1 cytochrome b/b6 domain-containing protein [Shewanella sp. NIFS-20-20]